MIDFVYEAKNDLVVANHLGPKGGTSIARFMRQQHLAIDNQVRSRLNLPRGVLLVS